MRIFVVCLRSAVAVRERYGWVRVQSIFFVDGCGVLYWRCAVLGPVVYGCCFSAGEVRRGGSFGYGCWFGDDGFLVAN